MKIGTFRKNVMRTIATKPAKLGMKTVSRDTARTNISHAVVALKKNTGQLLRGLSNYILGFPMTQEMKEIAFVDMGEIGYDLTVLCRLLKVKMPTATKRIKLVGTRTAALLNLDGLTTDLLQLVETGMFSSPQMAPIEKKVNNPQSGQQELRKVMSIDKVAEAAAEAARVEKMRGLLTGVVDLTWRLSFDIFGKPPLDMLEAKMERLIAANPNVEFTLDEAPSAKPVAAPPPVVKAEAAKPKAGKKAKTPVAVA